MYTRTITYVDYDGNERTEDFMFNLNKSELTTMEMSSEGGLKQRLSTMINKKDAPEIMRTFKKLLHDSYGEKSADGRRFVKSDEISTAFEQTEAYNMIFMELCTDAKKAAEFVENILPADLREAAKNAAKKEEKSTSEATKKEEKSTS